MRKLDWLSLVCCIFHLVLQTLKIKIPAFISDSGLVFYAISVEFSSTLAIVHLWQQSSSLCLNFQASGKIAITPTGTQKTKNFSSNSANLLHTRVLQHIRIFPDLWKRRINLPDSFCCPWPYPSSETSNIQNLWKKLTLFVCYDTINSCTFQSIM